MTSLESTRTKIITPKTINLKLSLNRSQSNDTINNDVIEENINEIDKRKKLINKICSPPPLDGMDVEQIRRFELEI